MTLLTGSWHLRFLGNPKQIRPEMLLQLNASTREGREVVEAIQDIGTHQQPQRNIIVSTTLCMPPQSSHRLSSRPTLCRIYRHDGVCEAFYVSTEPLLTIPFHMTLYDNAIFVSTDNCE